MGLHYSGYFVRRGGAAFELQQMRSPGEGSTDAEYGTKALSAGGGEAVFVFVSARGSGFQYEHAIDGTIVRALSYAETVWSRVDGEPEAWEAVLYPEKTLERRLEDLADDVEDAAERAPVEAALKELWSSHALRTTGLSFPVHVESVANAIHTHFDVPPPGGYFGA